MREQIVEFEGFNVTLKELTVRTIISIITNIPELFSEEPESDEDKEKTMAELVIKHRLYLLALLAPFVVRSDGEPIETLSEEIEKLYEPFMEVTPLFLPLVSEMIRPRHLLASDAELTG